MGSGWRSRPSTGLRALSLFFNPELVEGTKGQPRIGKSDISNELLNQCQESITQASIRGGIIISSAGLKDHGIKLPGHPTGIAADTPEKSATLSLETYRNPPSSFVKFFGTGGNRAPLDCLVLDEINGSGSHWACTTSSAHRQPEDKLVMFLTRMTENHDYPISHWTHLKL